MPSSRELRRRLGELPSRRRSFQAWRAARPAYELLGTQGSRLHGGRWNPPGVAVLYCALATATVRAEWARMMERQGLPESGAYPLRLGQIAVRPRTVDLRKAGALELLGIEEPLSVLSAIEPSRAVGAAAAREEIGALLVPSVTGVGANLVVFTDNLEAPAEVLEATTLRGPKAWP